LTDPDSHIMKDAEGAFVHAENAQAAVDAAHHILVAATVTAQPADAPHLEPMGAAIAENTGRPPTRLSADAGYFSERAGTAVAPHTDLSSATEKVKHSQPVPPAPRGRTPKTLSVRERMHRKARTTAGCRVRDAHGDRRARLRTDQRGARIRALSGARTGEGPR